MKKIFKSLTALCCVFLVNATTLFAFDFPLPDTDPAIIRLNVLYVDDHQFKIDFTITNTGNTPVSLGRFYYEVYLSEDAALEDNYVRVARYNFPDNAPSVGQGLPVYFRTLTYNTTAFVGDYQYVVMVLRNDPGTFFWDRNPSNNTLAASTRYCAPVLYINNTNINITNISDRTVNLSFKTESAGESPLHIERFKYTIYVSPDGHAVPTPNMIAVKSGVYSSTPRVLNKNQSMTITTSFVSPVDLRENDYLIIKAELLPGKEHILRTPGPHYSLRYLGLVIANPYMVDMDITEAIDAETNTVRFNFSVGNSGNKSADLYNYMYEVYMSQDYNIDASDVLVKSNSFYAIGNPILTPRSVLSGNISDEFSTPVNFNTYPFMLVRLKLRPGRFAEESTQGDNTKLAAILPHVQQQRVAQHFTVSQQNDVLELSNPEQSNTTFYSVYTSGGVLIQEGSFTGKKEIYREGLEAGIYIVHLSDGTLHESHRIVVLK